MSVKQALELLASQMEQDVKEVEELPVMRALVKSFARQIRLLAVSQEEAPPKSRTDHLFFNPRVEIEPFQHPVSTKLKKDLHEKHSALLQEDSPEQILVQFADGPFAGDSTLLDSDTPIDHRAIYGGETYFLSQDGSLHHERQNVSER